MISFAILQKEDNNSNETSGFMDPMSIAFKMILRYPPPLIGLILGLGGF